jgi:hypothetical protein
MQTTAADIRTIIETCKAWQKDGFSTILVRGKQETIGSKIYAAKTPYGSWKVFQSRLMAEEEMFEIKADKPDAVPALIGGYGNLENIDVDEKYGAGTAVGFLALIEAVNADLYSRLRIHRTPSGGLHILYRGDKPFGQGNQKLAVKAGCKEACIETRGEGGYFLIPPAPGYSVVQDNPVPVITLEERNLLIELARSMDERKAPVTLYKPAKAADSIYALNPFADFDQRGDIDEVLLRHGWSQLFTRGKYSYYTRPGKANGVSATYNHETGIFYVFSSSTILEPNRGYRKATLLAELDFGGDKTETKVFLESSGYGRMKPRVAKNTAKRFAQTGDKLPDNFPADAKQVYNEIVTKYSEQYPLGIFWAPDKEGGYKINKERILKFLHANGFRSHFCAPCVIDTLLLQRVSERYIYDSTKAYIKEDDERENDAIKDVLETLFQRSGLYLISRLAELDQSLILKDTKDRAYKFFKNGILEITATGYTLKSYQDFEGKLIWADKVQPRDFVLMDRSQVEKSVYYDYLNRAVGVEQHDRHLLKCIGYLTHEYKDESTGYILVMTEVVPNPKDGGGSGKNVFLTMLKPSTPLLEIPGSQVQYNEKFLQSWNGERIAAISDAEKNVHWQFLKNLSTNGGMVKKVYKDERTVDADEMPKLIVGTNFSFEISDGGLRRRIIPIEFTDFFTRSGSIKKYYGKMFPTGFTDEDWNAYYNLIAWAIQEWLAAGELSAPTLTETGWRKQFDMNYGENTRMFISEHWDRWTTLGRIPVKDFNEEYDRYLTDNGISQRYKLSSQRMNEALKEWSVKNGVGFDGRCDVRQNGVTTKYKVFTPLSPF